MPAPDRRIGAILVTVNPAYKTAELRYALDKAGVRLLVMAHDAGSVAMLDDVRDNILNNAYLTGSLAALLRARAIASVVTSVYANTTARWPTRAPAR